MATKPYQPLDPNAFYIVRNERWEDRAIWGVDLSLAEAQKRKETVAGRQLSRTVMIEPMPTSEDLAARCRELVLELPDHSSQNRYLVRNAGADGKIWGVDLSLAEAQKLKETLAGARRSRHMLVEPLQEITDDHLASPVGFEAAMAAALAAPPPAPAKAAQAPLAKLSGTPVAAAGVLVVPVQGDPLQLLSSSAPRPPTGPAMSAAAGAAAAANARVAVRAREIPPEALIAAAQANRLDDGETDILTALDGLDLSDAELAEAEALSQMTAEELVGDDLS